MIWPQKSEVGRRAAGCVLLSAGLLLLLPTACTTAPQMPATPTLADLPPAAPTTPRVVDQETRARAIEAYRDYLERYPDSTQRKDLLRRLADLEVARANSLLALSDGTGEGAVQPLDDPKALFETAAGRYQTLVQEYPEEQHNDEVLYQLAHALDGSGKQEASTATLRQVAGEGPSGNPELYSDSRFRRGETLFSRGDYAAAESQYQAVVDRGPQSPLYTQALYKLGWTRYKRGLDEQALQVFGNLLDHLLPAGGEVDGQIAALSTADHEQLEDGLRAMNLSFSSLGGARAAADYFERSGRRHYEALVFVELAKFYLAEERYHDAAQSYLILASREGATDAAAEFHARAIAIYREAGFQPRVLESAREYATSFGPGSAYWEGHDPAALESVRAELAPLLLELASHYDAEARSSGQSSDYDEAVKWYQSYLSVFDGDEAAAGARFQLAELWYAREAYTQAAREYERTAYDYGAHPQAANAGYGSVLAREALLKPGGTGIVESRSSFVATVERFAEKFPDHPQTPTALLRAAQEMFAAGDPETASQLANRLLRTQVFAAADTRKNAWVIYAQARAQVDDYAGAELGYREALAISGAQGSDVTTLRTGLAAAVYRQGERKLAADQPRAAARQFSRASEIAPDDALGARALYEAANAQLEVEDWEAAATTLKHFRQRYPEHALQADAARKLAIAYRNADDPAAAAREFESMAAATVSDERRRAGLLEAAELYREAGRTAEAVAALEQYLKQYGDPSEESLEVRASLAALSESQGDAAAHRRWLQSIIDGERGGRPNETVRMRTLAAEAALALGADADQAFQRVRLADPLPATLSRKTQPMQSALDIYETVAAYGIAEKTSEAIFRSAELYLELVRALRASPRPAGLNESQANEYELALEAQAGHLSGNAMELHQANQNRIQSGSYDQWIARSIDRLAVLDPARYARQEVGERFVSALQ